MVIVINKKEDDYVINEKSIITEDSADRIIVGTIDFEVPSVIVEAIENNKSRLLNLEKVGKVYVSVYHPEGQVPHVHLESLNLITRNGVTIFNFNSCICLHDALYFPHGGQHQDKFKTQTQKNQFNEWMATQNSKELMRQTNFEYAVNQWILLNGASPLTMSIKNQPDYTTISNDYNPNLRK